MKFTGKWIPDDQAFRQECLKISKDLSGFKKNPVFCRFINNDNRSYETAVAFYKYIVNKYPQLIEFFEVFKENDKIGDPTTYNLGPHVISPGTLRFIKVLGDITPLLIIKPKVDGAYHIAEIGSGYGGQCAVIKAVFPNCYYDLIDIPESLAVAKSYLKGKDRVKFFDCNNIDHWGHDLVISDYCISELDQDGVDFYINAVIQYSRQGYFTCNGAGVLNYFVEQLHKIFFQVRVVREEPKTSKHSNFIVYAMGNRYLQ